MRFILDTNEFIAASGSMKHPASEALLNLLLDSFPKHTLHLPRTIVNELRANLSAALFSELIKVIQSIASIDEDIVVPFEIGTKYESMGLISPPMPLLLHTPNGSRPMPW